MKLSGPQRWGLYGLALALTLAAVVWVERGSEDTAVVPTADRPAAETAQAPAERTKYSALGIDGLPMRAQEDAQGDPFSARSWDEMAAAEARRDAPPRPVVPQPPPMPFTYMGRLIEDKQVAVFLTRGEQHYIVRKGDMLERSYRVEEIGDNGMVLTYLPLKRKQQLSFDSAGGEGARGRGRAARNDDRDLPPEIGGGSEQEDAAWQGGGQISAKSVERDDE